LLAELLQRKSPNQILDPTWTTPVDSVNIYFPSGSGLTLAGQKKEIKMKKTIIPLLICSFSILGITGCQTTQTQKKQWEYKVVVSGEIPLVERRISDPLWGTKLQDKLNVLGKKGWEVSSFELTENKYHPVVAILKREI
jgi:hypothetical protein